MRGLWDWVLCRWFSEEDVWFLVGIMRTLFPEYMYKGKSLQADVCRG